MILPKEIRVPDFVGKDGFPRGRHNIRKGADVRSQAVNGDLLKFIEVVLESGESLPFVSRDTDIDKSFDTLVILSDEPREQFSGDFKTPIAFDDG
jgi:hypothetical protein